MQEESLENFRNLRSMLMQLQSENKSHKVRWLVTKFLADIDHVENWIINGKPKLISSKKFPALYDPVLNHFCNPALEHFLDEALADLAKGNVEMERLLAEINKPDLEMERLLAEINKPDLEMERLLAEINKPDPETDKSIKSVLAEIDL